jgi:hypothetical protein
MPTQWCCLQSKEWRNCRPPYVYCRVRHGANVDARLDYNVRSGADADTSFCQWYLSFLAMWCWHGNG